MADDKVHDGLRRGTSAITYRLPDGATPTVAPGETVSAGAILATVRPPPTVVAIADELRLGVTESAEMIESLDGAAITEGQVIASRRVGLRKRAIRAPISGVVRAVPAYGALLIDPAGNLQETHALQGGRVIEARPDAVTVATRIYRTWFAISAGPAWHETIIARASDDPQRSAAVRLSPALVSGHWATIVPHIDDFSELAPDRGGGRGPMIVGTVSDDVAWELLARADDRRARDDRVRPVVVLRGPGDAACGDRATRPLFDLGAMPVTIDHYSRQLLIFADGEPDPTEEEATERERETAAVYADPERWHRACIIAGDPHLATLETAFRTLALRTTSGHGVDERTPLYNITSAAYQ